MGPGAADRGGPGSGGPSYGTGPDMEVQEDTIFVSNMGTEVTEELLIQHFGSIGVIKVSVLFIYVFVCAHRVFFFLAAAALLSNSCH